jgi:hypothetical protein
MNLIDNQSEHKYRLYFTSYLVEYLEFWAKDMNSNFLRK